MLRAHGFDNVGVDRCGHLFPLLKLNNLMFTMGTGMARVPQPAKGQDVTPDPSHSAPWHPTLFIPIRKLPAENCDSMGFNNEGIYELT